MQSRMYKRNSWEKAIGFWGDKDRKGRYKDCVIEHIESELREKKVVEQLEEEHICKRLFSYMADVFLVKNIDFNVV